MFQDLTGLREGQAQPARGRLAQLNARAADNDGIVAANGSRIPQNIHRTADTPR